MRFLLLVLAALAALPYAVGGLVLSAAFLLNLAFAVRL